MDITSWLEEQEQETLLHIEDTLRTERLDFGGKEMNPELAQYEAQPDAFWQALPMMGCDGYDAISMAERRKWCVIPAWGRDGYDLGNWPLVIIFFRNRKESFDVIEYVEGDVTMYACPSQEIRQQVTDSIAFFHWHFRDEDWVKGYETVEQLPEELRGPYRAE